MLYKIKNQKLLERFAYLLAEMVGVLMIRSRLFSKITVKFSEQEVGVRLAKIGDKAIFAQCWLKMLQACRISCKILFKVDQRKRSGVNKLF